MKRWMQCENFVGNENDFVGRDRWARRIADGPALRPYHLDYATCSRKAWAY
jgi:hypothetical protein